MGIDQDQQEVIDRRSGDLYGDEGREWQIVKPSRGKLPPYIDGLHDGGMTWKGRAGVGKRRLWQWERFLAP
jgi:hypothetical protein